jgi:tetratricopeptide (TPR) repeat protein
LRCSSSRENAAAVVAICTRLDGLPLAIELAAARIKLLPPDGLLARLDQRLGLLSSGSRDLPARQQTLRGAIAWSFDLLEPGSQRLMARASTFSGGMVLDEAEAVCGPASELGVDVFDGLAGLVDQSLLRQVETTGNPRFRMLQTIRDFAVERLAESGEAEAIRRRHALAFLALAERAAPHLTGPDQKQWLDGLEAEIDNIRAAMAWTVDSGSAEIGLRLAASVWRLWQFRGYLAEGFERTTAILALRAASDDGGLRRLGLDAAGGLAYWRGDMDTARPLYEEALALARQEGDRAVIAEELYNVSFVYMVTKKDVPLARKTAEEALGLFRELGDRAGTAKALWDLGNADYYAEDFPHAREVLTEAAEAMRPLNDKFGLGWALHTLGLVQLRLGDLESARRSWTEMLEIFAAAGDVSGIGTALSNFRFVAVEDGDPERALRLAAASAAIVRRTGVDLATIIAENEGRADQERRMVDEAAAARAWEEGTAMSVADAIAYALAGAPGAKAAPAIPR